ncbi:hypothetical protein [Hydrocarboniphaga sp.]|uniref:hypothetical protein n=1 Tax=Hydrocarboniphaga sp. TaxID=2033016 RepID=UPI003D14AB80
MKTSRFHRLFPVALFGTAIGASAVAAPAQAYELNGLAAASDSQFKHLSADLLAALGSKGLSGPVQAETGGWGIAGSASTTYTDDSKTWAAVTGAHVDHIDVAGVDAWFQLPQGIRIGVLAAAIASTDDALWRIDASLPVATIDAWTVSGRASLGAVWSIKNVDAYTQTLGLEASRVYGLLQPYGGLGIAVGEFGASGDDAPKNQTLLRPDIYAGLRLNLPTFALSGVVDQTGHNTSLGLRLAVAF